MWYTDKYVLVCKVDIINENEQFILMSVYDPPEGLNEMKNDNIISLLKAIKIIYNSLSIIYYGDLNIPRNKKILILFMIKENLLLQR